MWAGLIVVGLLGWALMAPASRTRVAERKVRGEDKDLEYVANCRRMLKEQNVGRESNHDWMIREGWRTEV